MPAAGLYVKIPPELKQKRGPKPKVWPDDLVRTVHDEKKMGVCATEIARRQHKDYPGLSVFHVNKMLALPYPVLLESSAEE